MLDYQSVTIHIPPKWTEKCPKRPSSRLTRAEKPGICKGLCSLEVFFYICIKNLILPTWAISIDPSKLTWNIIMEVWFRSFSFLNGWFVGSSRSFSRAHHFLCPKTPIHSPRLPSNLPGRVQMNDTSDVHLEGYRDTNLSGDLLGYHVGTLPTNQIGIGNIMDGMMLYLQ